MGNRNSSTNSLNNNSHKPRIAEDLSSFNHTSVTSITVNDCCTDSYFVDDSNIEISCINSTLSSNNSKSLIEEIKMSMPLIISPTIKQTASVIFLHGLGDTGHGWASMFREIRKPSVKYIFPTAPIRSVTLNGGMEMTAWFDILGLHPGAAQDEQGLKQSSQILLKIVEDEIKNGIPSENIIIGGFSQGGATALYSLLTSSFKFGGVLALSTWLPMHEKFPAQMEKSAAKFDTPILQCHGDSDPLIPQTWASMSVKLLQQLGFKSVDFKMYRGLMHSSCEEEMTDLQNFINKLA